VHKLFDLIQCNKWKGILEQNGLMNHRNLVVRDCYLSFDQVYDLPKLSEEIQKMFDVIIEHIQSCPVSLSD
jgi:hypothetical protein